MKKLFIAAIAVIITAIMVFSLASCSVLKPLPKNETLGEALRNGGYELEWEDDFEGDSIDATRWRVGLNDPLRRAGYYVKDLAFVEDSNLIIRTEYRENGEYGKGWYTSWVESGITRGHTSASLGSEEYKGYATKYGYFEARCKTPKASGIWSAFWMMPTVEMAYSPRWERISRGWGSVSLMQPMPACPWKEGRSFSNFVRKGVFSIL